MSDTILVTSHVARDFLQNAAYFNTLPKVAWEYISNSLDNGRDNVPCQVVVEIRQDRLTVSDNGSGMGPDDLSRFFQMHGENMQRAQGKKVRGRFGTGKCAAFGIASSLTIDTNHGGRRNVVQLRLDDARTAREGKPFPVRVIIKNEATEDEDGTIVTVDGFRLRNLDIDRTIQYVEKHLARMRTRGIVLVNGHRCEYKEPPFVREYRRTPPEDLQDALGTSELRIRISPTPLPKEDNGIDILANGVWHETTLAELSGDHYSRIFGSVDVPILDDDSESNIPAFDNTRSNTLNRANERVVALLFWLQQELRLVQAELAREDRERRETEEARNLKKHASELSRILNDDFRSVIDELDLARKVAGRKRQTTGEEAGDSNEVLPGEGDLQSGYSESGQPHGEGHAGASPIGTGDAIRRGPGLPPGKSQGREGAPRGDGRTRSVGVFTIEFAHQTQAERRSKYDADTRTIYVNLDHPQVLDALRLGGNSINSPQFRNMCTEICAVEYALALQFERLNSGAYVDGADALFSVVETLDRVTRRLWAQPLPG